jgi:hypothetical protein
MFRGRSSAPLLLITLWACLLVTFMVVRPSPYSPVFWLLVGSATIVGGLYMLLSHRESRRIQHATVSWRQQVHKLVDTDDYADDGHLPEYLDEAERRRVIEELERMPAGSRSLRRAIRIVCPELIDDDG